MNTRLLFFVCLFSSAGKKRKIVLLNFSYFIFRQPDKRSLHLWYLYHVLARLSILSNNNNNNNNQYTHTFNIVTLLEMAEKHQPSMKTFDLKGSIPSYNVKSAIVACTGTPYVFLYGGFDQDDELDSNVYLLDTSTMTWEIDNKVEGLFREGHLAICIGNGNVLVFGGLPFEDEVPTTASATGEVKNDSLMMIYNIYEKKWIGPPLFALENSPSPRSRHACCLSEDGTKMYISGGLVKSSPLNDLYIYDLVTGIWLGPIEFVHRFDHTILVYKDRIFSFGGLDKDMNHVRSIVYYSLRTGSIGEIYLHSNDAIGALNEVSVLSSNINPSLCLKVNLPSWNSPKDLLKISCFNLDNFDTIELLNQQTIDYYFHDMDTLKCSWKSVFVNHNGKLYFLGKRNGKLANSFGGYLSTEDQQDKDVDEDETTNFPNEELLIQRLNFMLQINMNDFGISNTIDDSLSKDFLKLLIQQEFTDFEIICLENEEAKRVYESQPQQLPYSTKEIPVHKTILIARWPHFHTMLSSGMNESIENKLFLPEPYIRIKALIYYLYLGSIEFDSKYLEDITMVDYTGLLVLANMYVLRDLASLVTKKLFHLFHTFQFEFNDETEDDVTVLLKIWKELALSDERIFLSPVIDLIKKKWSIITRSNSFLNLTKDEIVKLCQDSTDERSNSTHKSPYSSIHSVDTTDLITMTPTRQTHSPFVIDSPANHSTMFNDL